MKRHLFLSPVSLPFDAKYSPSQPRVPAGHEGAGEWTSGGSTPDLRRVTHVIWVCIPIGISRGHDRYGNKIWSATLECADGRTFQRAGYGNAPGLVRDPFR
jgi:hypothetical protein